MESVVALVCVLAIIIAGTFFAKFVLRRIKRSARARRQQQRRDGLIMVNDPDQSVPPGT